MTRDEVRNLQRNLNRFAKTYLHDIPPLVVDGKRGHATNKRVRLIKYYLGYVKSRRTAHVGEEFIWRLHNPKGVSKFQDKAAIKRGKKRRKTQRRLSRLNKYHSYLHPGLTRYDGIPVAKAAVPILNWMRDHGWPGRLVSGYRTKAYSRHLCYAMCGEPYCPGRCAGDRTNHVGIGPWNFALDVTAYGIFKSLIAKCPVLPHLHNYLPIDPVHFSPSGR